MKKCETLIIGLLITNLIGTLFIVGYITFINLSGKPFIQVQDDLDVDIIGTVTNINKYQDEITMLVEGEKKEGLYDKAYVRVKPDTIITKTTYSRLLTPDEINIGDKVEIAFKGPVAESYPVQATAGWVWIIESEVE